MPGELERFLRTVITTDEGFFCLMVGPPQGPTTSHQWREEWFSWPQDLPRIIERVAAVKDTNNVYFTSHLFDVRSSSKEHVLPTRTVQADLDAAVVGQIPLAPTILVETSPNRHQGYWVLKDPIEPKDLENLSRRLAYSIPLCDRSGWSLGHKVRIPYTLNFKYDPPRPISVVEVSLRRYASTDFTESTRDVPDQVTNKTNEDNNWILNASLINLTEGPQEILERYRKQLPSKVLATYNARQRDRSAALWALQQSLFRAGATRDEVFWVAKHSANNKFKDARFHGDQDLAKDVVRAESASSTDGRALKDLINNIRKAPGTNHEKRSLIASLVIEDLEKRGEFVITNDNRLWLLDKESGRPILIARSSEYLDAVLDRNYGLNSSEAETTFVIRSIMAFTLNRGRKATAASLSYYDGTSLMLHGGRKEIYYITATDIETVSNGAYGVLFPWRVGEESFAPAAPVADDWASWMFAGFFNNVLDMTPEEAVCLIRVWIIFLLLRDEAVSRPILALFGQPGSGKSTLFRMVYALLYGPKKSLNAVTTQDNFDYLVAVDPLVVFDNVDTWASWLPDRLALSAATSDLVRRKLYTDADTIVLKRQAIIGISAHAPKFGRADVVDRLLILTFGKLKTHLAETPIIYRVANNRAGLWGGIIKDVQKVLATPAPPDHEVPQIRVADFAKLGLRIANALRLGEVFKSAVGKARLEQTAFNLGEEDVLVDALHRWLANTNGKYANEYLAPGLIWEYLDSTEQGFSRVYRTSSALAKKLWTIHQTLQTVFDIDYQYDPKRAVRLWRIRPRATP